MQVTDTSYEAHKLNNTIKQSFYGMKIHDRIVESKAKELSKTYKVIILNKRYTPDAIAIDWKNQRVIAVEVDNKRRYYQYLPAAAELKSTATNGSHKHERGAFDETILYAPRRGKGKGTWSRHFAETYDEALALRAEGLSYTQIAKRIGGGISTNTIWLWVTGRTTPLSIKRRELYETERIRVLDLTYEELQEIE